MTLQDPALQPSLVETLTASAFGYQLLAGDMPFTDPFGWGPEVGVDQALRLLGYAWQTHHADDPDDAMGLFRAKVARQRLVFVGPLDMGLLAHQPGSDRATGADHYVAVLDVADAWAQGLELPVPPGTLGGTAALTTIAERRDQGLADDLRDILINFSLRLGARRRQDAATWLMRIDETEIATNLQQQARILGSLQYSTVMRQWPEGAGGFRLLACTQADLTTNLAAR